MLPMIQILRPTEFYLGPSIGDLAAFWQSTQGVDPRKVDVAGGGDRANRGRSCRVVCRNLLENNCKRTGDKPRLARTEIVLLAMSSRAAVQVSGLIR